MWKAPFRPRETRITQDFNDGLVRIYAVTDGAKPGYQTKVVPTLKCVLRYQEQRLGLQRTYLAKQAQVEVERVIRTPRLKEVSTQNVAVTEDGRQYRIDLVQGAETYPPSMDLTLARLVQDYDLEEGTP